MKLIGVISDTHGRLDERVYAQLADCDEIIHAGDIGGPEILRELETLAPVHAVLGNNDFPEYGENVGRFATPCIEGVRFLVSHYPKDVMLSGMRAVTLEPGSPVPKVLIHGHTHVPRIIAGKEASPADMLLCPGSTFRPREGNPRSIAKIEAEDGRLLSVRVEDLNGNLLLAES